MTSAPTFRLKGEVAVDAVIWPDIRVGADVFSQHAGLLAADPAFLTDVFAPSPSTHINILLIRFVSVGLVENNRYISIHKEKKETRTKFYHAIKIPINCLIHTLHQIF